MKLFKTILFAGAALILSANVYNYLDKLYGYQLIQYYNLTELVPTETYKAKFDITIQPYSNESYLLGSYIWEDDFITRRNISVFIDSIYYETYIPNLYNDYNFNVTLMVMHYKNYDNINNQPVILSYLPYSSQEYYNELLETNANWLVLSNNNNQAVHISGYYNVNNYYYLRTIIREVINMPFIYHNLVNCVCLLMALTLYMV